MPLLSKKRFIFAPTSKRFLCGEKPLLHGHSGSFLARMTLNALKRNYRKFDDETI
jgi:hypothetical protein